MSAVNTWAVGLQYDPKFSNIAWEQPGGIGTAVLPAQVSGGFDLLSTRSFNERTGCYLFTCQHSANMVMVFKDYDVTTGLTVALLACPLCSYVERFLSPWDRILNPVEQAILYP